ncbi:MAG: hypothetical protein EZS28_031447 [Streblomastix strix]|uniref:Uncharacterized protein n=1 Tax=Streblomastix strix TaxID=222440 RepID=A0A5J4UQS5_9EUKA|nr:MAG: hypothetical protein EZS28_031447 [Streblomastix strix]
MSETPRPNFKNKYYYLGQNQLNDQKYDNLAQQSNQRAKAMVMIDLEYEIITCRRCIRIIDFSDILAETEPFGIVTPDTVTHADCKMQQSEVE